MIFDYTPEEKAEIENLEERYSYDFSEINEKIEYYRTQGNENMVRELEADKVRLIRQQNEEREALYKAAEKRAFDEIQKTPEAILADAGRQYRQAIESLYTGFQQQAENGKASAYYMRADGEGNFWLDKEQTAILLDKSAHLHRVYFIFTNPDELHGYTEHDLDALLSSILEADERVSDSKGDLGRETEKRVTSSIPEVREDATYYMKKPDQFILNVTKANSSIFNILENKSDNTKDGILKELENEKHTSEKMSILVGVDENIDLSGGLNAYDMAVHDAIITLYKMGTIMTVRSIYKQMTGRARPSEGAEKEIMLSIKKMGDREIEIDLGSGEEEKYGGRILYTEYLKNYMVNGKKTTVLHVLREPVLYLYAKKLGRVREIDCRMLEGSEEKNAEINLSYNKDNIAIKSIIARRVEAIKSGVTSRWTSFQYLYDNIGVVNNTTTEKKKNMKIRKFVSELLEFFQSTGYIDSYQIDGTKGFSIQASKKSKGK